MKITKKIAQKVLDTVSHGLCSGIGEPVPGKMCVEAAVCFSLGLPHSDNPPCVSRAVRAFKMRLNDSNWSSNAARAAGLKRLSVAQLGSESIDDNKFRDYLVRETIRQIVPLALRSAARVCPKHAVELEARAQECESDPTKEACLKAKTAAASAAYAAASAAAAAAAASSAYAAGDKVLLLSAEIAVSALKDCKAPGIEWLSLCS